jgi:ABC-type polysaccharide/polyol phosphate transport system ATPase subunit
MALIEVNNLSLSYPVYGSDAMSVKSTILNMATGGFVKKDTKHVFVDALRNVSFSLEKGDRLALIGHNGAGKSTLLRVLAKVYEPTFGDVTIKGKSNCLFDLMMGLDFELNGYENIILRGRISGLSKKEALKIIPSVEEFAELGHFMNMPIKSYSSGMQIRLAFGIITSIVSEIILIDEIINVGDVQFVKKARLQIGNLINQADILVLSTHDLNTVKDLCNKAIWLEHGRVVEFGPVNEIVTKYEIKHKKI